MYVHDSEKRSDDSSIVSFQGHANAILDLSWGHNFQIATVSGDQTVRVWQIQETGDVEPLSNGHFKNIGRSVKCVEFLQDHNANILAAGTRSAGEKPNALMLWDLRDDSSISKPVLQIESAHSHSAPNVAGKKSSKSSTLPSSITAIQFQDEHKIVSVSDNDGLLKVWDLRKSYDRFKGAPQPLHCIAYPGKSNHRGYTSLAMNSSRSHVYASCRDHFIYCFDLASYSAQPVRSYGGYINDDKFYIRLSLSFDDNYIACGSSDQSAYIWSTSALAPTLPDSPSATAPIYRLNSDDEKVTCVAWSKADWKLVTCEDDESMKHRIWRVEPHLESEDVVGRAEDTSAQYSFPSKFPLNEKIAAKLDNKCDNLEDQIRSPDAKRRCLRSPLASLQTTPQKLTHVKKLSSFPCSPRKMVITPKKSSSARKLLPFPNLIKDGTSPHQPSRSSKKTPLDWLSKWKLKRSSTPEETNENVPKRKTPKRTRGGVKKSLNMNV